MCNWIEMGFVLLRIVGVIFRVICWIGFFKGFLCFIGSNKKISKDEF